MSRHHLIGALVLLAACNGNGSGELDHQRPRDLDARLVDQARPDLGPPAPDRGPDRGPPPDQKPPTPDQGRPPPQQYKVAAIQYGTGNASLVKASCAKDPTPNVCALKVLVTQAAAAGALLVLLPEYGFGWDQQLYEPVPTVGDNPATNTAWPQTLLITAFAKLAKQHKLYLVIHLTTVIGPSPGYSYYNTQVAFGPTGKVLAVHHKFNLWDDEPKTFTPGKQVSVFATPLGQVGLLICADIDVPSPLHTRLVTTLKARVIAFSAHWLTKVATAYQAAFAKTHGVYFVAANTVKAPGQGGGVFAPGGTALASTNSTVPSIVYAQIPTP